MLDRAEVVALLRHHDLYAGKDVLDIGVGTGRTSAYLAPLCHNYQAIDYSPVMVEALRNAMPQLAVQLCDMRDLSQFKNESFDFVLAPNNVFDAVDHADRLKTLRECHRVLRPAGVLMFDGHNLAYAHAGRSPQLEWCRNPVTLLKHFAIWLRQRANHYRLRSYCGLSGEHAVFTDDGHDFSLLHYYISRNAQREQLTITGFELMETIDRDGDILPESNAGAHSSYLLYVARRSGNA